jgi:hypothetical protein
MVFIYILKLVENKFYVGKTRNPCFRLDSHFEKYSGGGSAWTRKYKPLAVEQLIPDCDDYDEDKYTRIYMDKYGIDNVRGGSFVSVHFSEETKRFLQQMSNGTNGRCFLCGGANHFVRDCKKVNFQKWQRRKTGKVPEVKPVRKRRWIVDDDEDDNVNVVPGKVKIADDDDDDDDDDDLVVVPKSKPKPVIGESARTVLTRSFCKKHSIEVNSTGIQ